MCDPLSSVLCLPLGRGCSLSFPLDVVKTEFKLVATYRGWEYVILTLDPATTRDRPVSLLSPEMKRLFVTVIEFESVAIVLGNLGVRISLVAYPVISIDKVREIGGGLRQSQFSSLDDG